MLSDPSVIGAPPLITVTDLRQFTYCPRVPFFMGMLPRPLTGKMRLGKRAHEDEEERERRRSLRAYHLKEGQRQYAVQLEDPMLGLRAKLDMLVVTADEVIPIEHKLSEGPVAATHRIQLMAYGMLAEAAFGLPARRGFVYWIPARRASEVRFTAALAQEAIEIVRAVQAIRRREELPEPTPILGRCSDCEFRRFCGDRPRP